MSSSENTIFGTVLGYANRAGKAARDVTAAAKEALTSAEPGVTAALAKAKALAEPGVTTVLAKAKAAGASAMSEIQKARAKGDHQDDQQEGR
jgi:hypothetical protein